MFTLLNGKDTNTGQDKKTFNEKQSGVEQHNSTNSFELE